MFSPDNQEEIFRLTKNRLGKGSFGSVYVGETDKGIIAVKCETSKKKDKKNLTLLREYMISKTFYTVINYLGLNNRVDTLRNNIISICHDYFNLKNTSNKNTKTNKKNNNINNQIDENKTTDLLNINEESYQEIKLIEDEINKKQEKIESMNKYDQIKIFNYINDENMLTIPHQMNIKFLLNYKCVPCIIKYIECTNHNFLLMELCGNNFDDFLEKYKLTETGKYFIADHLLNTISCVHRCGVVHRDIKMSNIVLNKKIDSGETINLENNKNISTNKTNNTTSDKEIYPIILDMGLSNKYYKIISDKIIKSSVKKNNDIVGTLRYISLNIHEYNSPTIVDDLISLSYVLAALMTEKKLPWVGHKRDNEKFNPEKHKNDNCKCGYHRNKKNNSTQQLNTIAELKFHTPLDELTKGYPFLKKWIKYLYSLGLNQFPSYTFLYKELNNEINEYKKKNKIDQLFFEYDKKIN